MSNPISKIFSRGHYSEYRRGFQRVRVGGPGGGSHLYRWRANTSFVFTPGRRGFDRFQPVFGYFAGGGWRSALSSMKVAGYRSTYTTSIGLLQKTKILLLLM